jgi:sporulation protein YlmC with PRC-barrel domain
MTAQPTPQSPHDRRQGPVFRPAGNETYDLVLRVLDHQVVGPDGRLLGKVDGLELVRDGDALWVTGLAVGIESLADRMPGRLGDWMDAVWRRFHPEEHPQPTVVPITHVTGIGSSVALDREAAAGLTRTFGIELWLRDHVISRIPGASSGGQDRQQNHGAAPPSEESDRRVLGPRPDGLPITRLLGRPVLDAQGRQLGNVWELRGVGAPSDARQAPLLVTHLRAGRHRFATDLGYASDEQRRPALVARPARFTQRHDVLLRTRDVDLDSLDTGVIRVRPSASPPPRGAR